MTSLTFYGGVNEIGGNKILLEDQNTRIFLDFGMSFSIVNQYFDEFMQPRKCNGILDLLEFGLLPDLEGIYRCDYLDHCNLPSEEARSIEGVLLSHAHMDHNAYVHYLREDILKGCVGVLEDNFLQANKFRPRDIAVGAGKFMYINDEDVDRRDELIDEGTVELSSDIEGVIASNREPNPVSVPISAVDASSALIGETNRGIISAVRVALWTQEPGQKAQLYRYGPSLAHFTSDNANFLFNMFQQDISGLTLILS
jgi:mRNA degradation ribonuclease J1/J2